MASRVLLHLLTLEDNKQMYLLYLNLWGVLSNDSSV